MQKKSFLALFILAFVLGIGYKGYQHFQEPIPILHSKINIKEDLTIKKSFNFKNRGCYEVGLWSKSSLFDGRGILKRTKNGSNYPIMGNYTISYFKNGTLIQRKVVKGNNLSSVSMDGPEKASKLAFDRLEIPFQEKYNSLTIKLEIKNADRKFKDSEEDIFFFIDKTNLSCDKRTEYRITKRKFNIEVTEDNVSILPLYKALIQKKTIEVKSIIDNGMDKEITMVGNRRPIHYSAYFNDENTLLYLISKKIDLNIKDKLNMTPIQYAFENNATKSVEILLANGVDLKSVKKIGYDYPILRYTSSKGYYELTELLLKNGFDPNIGIKDNKETIFDNLEGQKNSNNYHISNGEKPKYPGVDKMIQLLKKYGAKSLYKHPMDRYVNKSK